MKGDLKAPVKAEVTEQLYTLLNDVQIFSYVLSPAPSATVEIDMSSLPEGIYFVVLCGGHIDGDSYYELYAGYAAHYGNFTGFHLREIGTSTHYTVSYSKPSGYAKSMLTVTVTADSNNIAGMHQLLFVKGQCK